MMKECFGLKSPDAQKYRECAQCPIAEPCVRSVYLGEARCVDRLARVAGFALGAFGLVLAALTWTDMPHGAPWLLLLSAVYLLSVHQASKAYALENAEEGEAVRARAEAGPAAAPAGAHGHH